MNGLTSLFIALALGFSLIVVLPDLIPFSPARVPSWTVFTLMALQGFLTSAVESDIGVTIKRLVLANGISLATLLSGVVATIGLDTLPVDLVIGFGLRAVIGYTVPILIFESIGFVAGLAYNLIL